MMNGVFSGILEDPPPPPGFSLFLEEQNQEKQHRKNNVFPLIRLPVVNGEQKTGTITFPLTGKQIRNIRKKIRKKKQENHEI